MQYPDFGYTVRAERRGGSVVISVLLDRPLPAVMVGRAGFNHEFVPSACWHHAYLADGRPALFPRHPADAMQLTAEPNAGSGRSDSSEEHPASLQSLMRT